MVWNIKQVIEDFERILKDKKFCEIHYKKVEKIKTCLKDKRELEKFYREFNVFSEKGDMSKDFLKNLENEKNSLIKNPQLEEKHRKKLLKGLEKSKEKGLKEVKEAEEYFKK